MPRPEGNPETLDEQDRSAEQSSAVAENERVREEKIAVQQQIMTEVIETLKRKGSA